MKRARIVVIGSSNTDLVVQTDRIPAPGETVLGGDLVMTAGGKGANQAVAAARLGAEVVFVARLGQDAFGDSAISAISSAGVITEYIRRDLDAPSGVALIAVDSNGQNSIVVAPGANARLSPADVDFALPAIESSDAILLQLEIPLDTVRHAIQLGAKLGKRVILNPAPATQLPAGFLDGVHLITPNEHEAVGLLGLSMHDGFDAGDTAKRLLGLGVNSVVVTLGARGAIAATQSEKHSIEGFTVQAVDTTAAGDCFTGALAVGLAEGMDLPAACRFASHAAAISVTRLGAQASMPARAETEAILA
jgi:ribokinase